MVHSQHEDCEHWLLTTGGTSTSGAAVANEAMAPFRRLLTGSGSSQMNLGAVSRCSFFIKRMASMVTILSLPDVILAIQVKNRAEELKRSLDQVITALEHYADKVQW